MLPSIIIAYVFDLPNKTYSLSYLTNQFIILDLLFMKCDCQLELYELTSKSKSNLPIYYIYIVTFKNDEKRWIQKQSFL